MNLLDFRAAVAAIHSSDAGVTDGWREANAYLVTFAESPGAASLCEAVLAAADASSAEQTFAAGILARAANPTVLAASPATVSRLLQLCHAPMAPAAVSSLAAAVAAATCQAGAEEALVRSADLATLTRPRRLIVLQALADALCQTASIEELRFRPRVVAACTATLAFVRDSLLSPPSVTATPVDEPVDPAAALQCLAAWAGCGIDFVALALACPEVASLLMDALEPQPLLLAAASTRFKASGGRPGRATSEPTRMASLAAGALRALLQGTLDAGELLQPPALASVSRLLAVLAAWHGDNTLGDPPGAGTSDNNFSSDHGASGAFPGSATPPELMMAPPPASIPCILCLRAESNDLACNLVAVAALTLEAVTDLQNEAPGVAGAGPGEPGLPPQAAGALQMLLACSSHPLPGPADVAADGWLGLARTQTAPLPAGSWWRGVFRNVTIATAQRCSRGHLARGWVLGAGDDDNDLDVWRERSAQPLLTACSELLGLEDFLPPLTEAVQGVATRLEAASASGDDLDLLEALLFALGCTSPRCLRTSSAEARAGLLAGVANGAANLAHHQHERVAWHARVCYGVLTGSEHGRNANGGVGHQGTRGGGSSSGEDSEDELA